MAIDAELKKWIGRTATYVAPEEVGRAGIRYFALALHDDNPLYQDATYAAASRHGDIIAPPTMVCETSQFIRQAVDENGYMGHNWPLPIKCERFIRGGNEYEFFQPMKAGDRITVTWKILDIYERETRAFGAAVFVISEARYVNHNDDLLAINRETNIYAS